MGFKWEKIRLGPSPGRPCDSAVAGVGGRADRRRRLHFAGSRMQRAALAHMSLSHRGCPQEPSTPGFPAPRNVCCAPITAHWCFPEGWLWPPGDRRSFLGTRLVLPTGTGDTTSVSWAGAREAAKHLPAAGAPTAQDQPARRARGGRRRSLRLTRAGGRKRASQRPRPRGGSERPPLVPRPLPATG